MLDALGERYGLLPSEVLARGTTFDLRTYDIALTHKTREIKKQNGTQTMKDITDQYDQTDLQAIMERTRGNKSK
tara:strand:- start:7701 stop:7922 length:222 start_codon:yes stop_codon:yes gene_type:complete